MYYTETWTKPQRNKSISTERFLRWSAKNPNYYYFWFQWAKTTFLLYNIQVKTTDSKTPDIIQEENGILNEGENVE